MENILTPSILCAIIIILIVLIRKKTPSDYDERQLIVRNIASRNAFLMMLLMNIVVAIDLFMNEQHLSLAPALLMASAFIGLTYFGVYTILKDAYKTKETNYTNYLPINLIAAGANILAFFFAGPSDSIYDLVCSVRIINLYCAITFTIFIVVFLYKWVEEKNDEKS